MFSSIGTFLRSLSIIISGLIITYFSASNLFEVIIQLSPKTFDLSILLKILFYLFIFRYYSVFFIFPSFSYKRQEFFVNELAEPTGFIKNSSNIYQIENGLFQILGRNKPREIPIDFILISFSLLILCIILIVNTITTPFENYWYYFQIFMVLLTGLGAIMMLRSGFIRENR